MYAPLQHHYKKQNLQSQHRFPQSATELVSQKSHSWLGEKTRKGDGNTNAQNETHEIILT